ncbi:MAG: amidohydrolase family protein [Gemmatimonadota bacterium]|nr:amidohydrolase family protein [Gemmatimonadota bacterium]
MRPRRRTSRGSKRRNALARVGATACLAGQALACQAAPEAAPATTAFVDVSVLPMDPEGVLEGQTVLVREGTITEVGPVDEVVVDEGATVIDGEGRFLMPGLAEMHAHVPPGDTPPRDEIEDILFLYVANGITTIRGMLGSDYQLPLAEEIARGDVLGPTFYVGAPSLNGETAPTPDAAETLVRRHAEAGYHLQKIHPGVPRAAWDRMVEVAEEVGIPFGGHVPAEVGVEHAIRTGMSTVDHLDGYVQAVAPEGVVSQVGAGTIDLEGLVGAEVDATRIEELVELTREHDTYVVPTLYLWENLYGTTDPEPFLELPEMRYVSEAQRDAWRQQASGGPRGSPQAVRAFVELRNRILKGLADGDAGILMGTDSPQLFNVPGFALHREIATMAEAGMTPRQILTSGTVAVGRYVREHLGIDHHFGTVATGQRADLLLLEADPLEDLRHLRDRAGVMVNGHWLPEEEIRERLETLAAKHES